MNKMMKLSLLLGLALCLVAPTLGRSIHKSKRQNSMSSDDGALPTSMSDSVDSTDSSNSGSGSTDSSASEDSAGSTSSDNDMSSGGSEDDAASDDAGAMSASAAQPAQPAVPVVVVTDPPQPIIETDPDKDAPENEETPIP